MVEYAQTPITPGTQIAADIISGIVVPRTKVQFGGDGFATDVSDTTPLPTIGPYLPAGTNRSGTITTGGVAQSLAPANASRRSLAGMNISAGDLWINEIGGTAAVGAAGSYKIASGDTFEISTNRAVSIIGATTGQAFTATET